MSVGVKPAKDQGSAAIIAGLRDDIHKGRFVPGQRLIEADLVDRFGLGRAKVREALRMLQHEGLVQIDRNRGASVRRVSRREVRDTLELLRVISVLMAEKTLDRRDEPGVRAALLDSVARTGSFRQRLPALAESREFMDENARFWDVIAELSDNRVLIEARIRLETTLFRLVLEGARITGDKDRWIARHEDILDTILAGNRIRARKLVTDSVLAVEAAMLALPNNAFD
jgi:DNA-binding GntR family transcriptional regulator